MTHNNNASNNVPSWLRVDTDRLPPAQAAPQQPQDAPQPEPQQSEPHYQWQRPEPESVTHSEAWSEPQQWQQQTAADQNQWAAPAEPVPPAQRTDSAPASRDTFGASKPWRSERRSTSSGAHRKDGDTPSVSVDHFVSPAPASAGSSLVFPTPETPRSEQSQYELTPPVALDQSNLVNPVKRPPRGGWRKALYTATFGLVNLGDSPRMRRQDELLTRIRTPLRGDYRIAVMSLKGGVGKTTTTIALGGIFAQTRGDRVVAIDANPDLGTLAQRVSAQGTPTIRDLLAAEDTSRYTQVKDFTTQAPSRLEVIGSERDPAVSESFSERDYRDAIAILQRHYSVILTDCGTGLMHSAMGGVLELADTLVLVTSAALDGAQSAAATLDWLNLHGYEQLAANSVVVVSSPAQQRSAVDLQQLVGHFRSRTRAVHVVPFDPHLAEGGDIDLERLSRPTQEAYMQLAATIAQDFGSVRR